MRRIVSLMERLQRKGVVVKDLTARLNSPIRAACHLATTHTAQSIFHTRMGNDRLAQFRLRVQKTSVYCSHTRNSPPSTSNHLPPPIEKDIQPIFPLG